MTELMRTLCTKSSRTYYPSIQKAIGRRVHWQKQYNQRQYDGCDSDEVEQA